MAIEAAVGNPRASRTTRPSTEERSAVLAKTLIFGDTPTTKDVRSPTTGPHRQRIRHANVCRGKVVLTASTGDTTVSSPPGSRVPPSRQHRAKPSSPRIEHVPESPPPAAYPLEAALSSQARQTHPIHVTIVDNIRPRKRTSGLRTAQPTSPQNGLLCGHEETLTIDDMCSDPLEGDTVDPHADLTPLVSPKNPTCYSQTQRASWSGKVPAARRRSQSNTATSVDMSNTSLSSYSGDVSADNIVAEIDTIKTILIREQLMERLSRAAAVIDRSVLDLHALTKPARKKSAGSATSRNGDNNEGDERPTAAQKKQMDAMVASLERRIVASTHDLLDIGPELRQITVKVVDAIEGWRHTLDDTATRTNRPPTVRTFLFQGENYLEKMSQDLCPAYDGVALAAVFKGPSHPFLLPHDVADQLHAALGLPPVPALSIAPCTTFVTTSALVADTLSEIVSTLIRKRIPSSFGPQNNESTSLITAEVRRATAAIFRERHRVQADAPRSVEPAAYDPFDTIRQYPTVADAFDRICRSTRDAMDDTREALRLRQQDTTRARDQTLRAVQKPLTMNHAAVEALVAKKVAAESASIMPSKGAAAASTCRLAGHVLIRKKPSRGDPVLRSVLKIQAQFRRHHSRLELLLSLKAMTHRLHMAATHIQRIYRGHRAKAMMGQVQRSLWADERFFHLNARRVQRWLRHRRLERVEAAKRQVAAAVVIPVELPAVPVGPSLTDVYREAGRKRRMERDRVTTEKRAQAALLIEKKHQGCHVIQGAFRHYNKRKTMRMLQLARRMSQESNAATHIQSFVRCTLAKKYARQLHARRELDTVHHSSTLIQATYRGHRVRQRMSLAATMAATKEVAGSPTKTRLPSVVLKPAVLKPHPTRPSRRRTAVTVPKPLQSPRDRLPSLVQQGRRKPGVSWEELKLKEPRIGDQL